MSNATAYNINTTIPALRLSPPALAWAREHGSTFLRFWAEEGTRWCRLYRPEHESDLRLSIERGRFCRIRYNEERARKEAPGWSLLCEATYPSPNPPEEAMDLLARAREQFPTARLRQVRHDDRVEYIAIADAPWPDGYKLVFNDRVIVATVATDD